MAAAADQRRIISLLSIAAAFMNFLLHIDDDHGYFAAVDAAIVQQNFTIESLEWNIQYLCNNNNTTTTVTVVNRQMPGPTIYAKEGDNLIIHVLNKSPYNVSMHWHGVFQKQSGWADGANMITQCPLIPGSTYTYKFNISGQQGTMWWHAHASSLRATLYGPLIVLPSSSSTSAAAAAGYPFPTPFKQIPILLGEWWNTNVAVFPPTSSTASDAFTINGLPGDNHPCTSSPNSTFTMQVEYNQTYLLRVINAALNTELFFKVAGHNFTVVAADACYTAPFSTDVLVLAPGQTIDALMTAAALPNATYYMAASAYISIPPPVPIPIDSTTATGIVVYINTAGAASTDNSSTSTPPIMPSMPATSDSLTADRFYSSLIDLNLSGTPTVPLKVDKQMLIAYGLGSSPASGFLASMNNVSFQFPASMSLLQAHFNNASGVYTTDFPENPPFPYDYTNSSSVQSNPELSIPTLGTKVRRLQYNDVVEVVLQNTALVTVENHPIHLHGFNFFVLATGFGNYNATAAAKSFNLVNPHRRNTIAVPAGGWAVIRFVADNPGMWFFHCHLDIHLALGLGMALEVMNGTTPDSVLPPPPPDYPSC